MKTKARLLIADTEPYWRTDARVALERSGYRVIELKDYASLPRSLTPEPDLVILGFPSVDPHAEAIIHDTLKRIPNGIVLVLSSSWQIPQSVERRLFRMGVSDVQGRPADTSELVTLVDQELAARKAELETMSSYARFRLQGAQ